MFRTYNLIGIVIGILFWQYVVFVFWERLIGVLLKDVLCHFKYRYSLQKIVKVG